MTAPVRTLGPGTLRIHDDSSDSKNFDTDVTNVKLEPEVSKADSTIFMDGHEEAGEQSVTWKLSGTIKEDYSENGVQAWCLKHQGKTLKFEFIPNKHATMKAQGNVNIVPLSIGGDVKSQNDVDFEFSATNVQIDFSNPAA